jgi:glyoxylase-like metal-dependent hydrolase (beta-lactamase superfamily II)
MAENDPQKQTSVPQPGAKRMKQEQEPARSEVTEISPNVLRMELPIRMPGLGHVNCYALIDSHGAAVVDPGMPGPDNWNHLKKRLKLAGLKVSDVHTVVVTHSHPDHFGGANRFVDESDARVIAHRSFRFGVTSPPAHDHHEVSVDDLEAQREREAAGSDAPPASAVGERVGRAPEPTARYGPSRTPWGGRPPRPPMKSRLKWSAMRLLGKGGWVPTVTAPVKAGDVLHLAGREWFIVHTPGHTEDHICLHNREDGLFLAGDHVLPTITPHISGLSTFEDPLKEFFVSLDEAGALPDVKLALPAHGHPFEDLAGRCEAIKEHHDERLDRVKEISRMLGSATVEAFSQQLFKKRSWGAMAESETFAHLEHLRILGEAEQTADAEGNYLYLTS